MNRYRRSGRMLVGLAFLAGLLAFPARASAQQALLDAVSEEFDSLPGIDLDADAQTMLDFINGRAEVTRAGKADNPRSVWAILSDGVRLIIPFNLTPPPNPQAPRVAARSPQAESGDLPRSNGARVLHSLGFRFYDPTPDIKTWLYAQGYSPTIASDATVWGLKAVNPTGVEGDGVFYIDAHGGEDEDSFYLWTETPVTPENDRLLDDDLKSVPPRLVKMDAAHGLFNKLATHYAISADFVRYYWGNFGDHAFVFINACGSDGPAAQDFKAAVRSKHANSASAPVYAGWTDEANNRVTSDTAKLVFDRLLGANQVFLEDGFKQRPFDYPSVLQDLPKHGLGTSLNAVLQFTPPVPGDGDFELLAPSIATAFVSDPAPLGSPDPVLSLYGVFGKDPRPAYGTDSVSVTVNGRERTISSWNDSGTQIVTDIPAFGDGSSGDVVVTVRGHKSNVARITEWQVQVNYTFLPPGPGSLGQTVTYTLDLRADIRKFRRYIHDPPQEPWWSDSLMQDSLASFTCNGAASVVYDDPPFQIVISYGWDGHGNLVPMINAGPDNNFIGGVTVSDSHNMDVHVLENGSYQACNFNVHEHECTDTGCFDTDDPGTQPLFGLFDAFKVLHLALDDGANVVSDSLQNEAQVYLYQAPLGTAHWQVQWFQLLVTAPPDPDSAR